MIINRKLVFLAFVIATGCSKPAESPNTYFQIQANPLFNEFNKPINFSNLKEEHFTQGADSVIAHCRKELEKIYQIDAGDRTFDNTMLALDDLYDDLERIASVSQLMQSTHPDSLIRNAALESFTRMEKFGNEISLSEDLYQAVKDYSKTSEASGLTKNYQVKFLKETLEDFERNGFALSKEKRDTLKLIKDEITEIGNAFDQNIAAYQDFLIVSEKDMEGLSKDYKDARKLPNGTYRVDLSYPSYQPFMKFAKSDKARQALYMKYYNRAADKNTKTLQRLLQKRKEMATLLGYSSYAAWRVADRMAKDTETVWNFEHTLSSSVKAKADIDYQELLDARNYRGTGATGIIQPWQNSFVNNILLEEKYQVDEEAIKAYFPLDAALDGLFQITQSLFNVTYKEVQDPSVWNPDVREFEVYDNDKLIGRFYLDFFPRDNKYKHAACFGMIKGKSTPWGYQIPNATLVCNFPPPTPDKPSLMPHSQVRSLFHEFGHVLHQMLTTADLSKQSGTSVARDFVEAPSQIFENWIWDYTSLVLFAKHYETGEVLPKELYEKMIAAKNVGSGLATESQILYGTLDMTLHDKYDPFGEIPVDDVVRDLTMEITHFPYISGTHFQTAFGHLNGYGASYYGYMWSKVYAEDMFSEFSKHGVLEKNTGLRYRNIILAKGGSEEPMDLVKEFLGREPNNEAFLKSLGL
ncbi:MAG: Zn-dependent oligopeptidase [Cyclobacteriaceae bacterium]|nr:Zn-dependent oligopeptidase [Cyclobacteriaceae bacterium]MDH4296852.1 Zn-dependent oligopeptidase [Cyclobacteriaceae bacterium]MDH5248319.1 Zn-dependent oligopeptidase [Cyclobacteriaceae bacterium]